MALKVVPYTPEYEPLVRDFNARMAAAGTDWRFYEKAKPRWLPRGTNPNVWREYYVAVDDTPAVRGAYCLKPQAFLVRDQTAEITSIQGPISEGLVDPRFGSLALHLIRDMQQKRSELFAWGPSERLTGVLSRLRWNASASPLALRVVRPYRFLRRNRFLRVRSRTRLALDVLAATGLGFLGVHLAQTAQRVAFGGLTLRPVQVEEEVRFGSWADEVWAAAARHYDLIARRDSEIMNALLPQNGWPEATIIRVSAGRQTVGWVATRDAQLETHPQLGDLRVGVLLDSLALPHWEKEVVSAAVRHLERRGVDLVLAHHSHRTWVSALRANGFWISANRRVFMASPALSHRLGDANSLDGFHMTLLDGDGPLGF